MLLDVKKGSILASLSFYLFFIYLVAYLSTYHEKAVNALYELA